MISEREYYRRAFDRQGGNCYLCESPLHPSGYPQHTAPGGIHIDHDPRCCGPLGECADITGKPCRHKNGCHRCRRGLTHRNCNLIAGLSGDDPEMLERIGQNLAAARYGVGAGAWPQ